MEEIIRDIKNKKRTLHIAFFDLADAFGSVPHDLIHHTLNRNHFPQPVQEYFKNLYSCTKSKVVTKNFQTDPFSFRNGVTQGDPMSPIIFILTFQPILDFLIKSEKFGIQIKDQRVITLPYADDFCLITSDMRTHQWLINEINSHIQSMGMQLKPSKCRSFSIKSGKPSVVPFNIEDKLIPSIANEEQKFLGKVIFFSGKSKDTFEYFREIFQNKLSNIDSAMVRGENKMWMYQHYFLPSIRFLLTIHDITVTDLKKLDAITHRFMKSWSGVPSSGTNLIFHMQQGLEITSISDLYEESHCINHVAMRLKGDPIVNSAMNNAIERESQFTRKGSVVVRAEEVFEAAIHANCADGELPNFPDTTWNKEKEAFSKQIKKLSRKPSKRRQRRVTSSI